MQIVLLLVAGVALAYFSKPKDRESYQIALLAILGVAYFTVWRFVDYYMDIMSMNSTARHSAFLLIMLVALALAALPQCRNISRRPAIIFAVIFAVVLTLTFAFEVLIKNTVADIGGYFDKAPIKQKALPEGSLSQPYYFDAGGVGFDIPVRWSKEVHSSGHVYFDLKTSGKLVAEMRPRCFHGSNISLPEIIQNISNEDRSKNLVVDSSCYMSSDDMYTCSIRSYKSENASSLSIWRWLVTDKYQHQSIEIDFIFYVKNIDAERDAEAVMSTLRVKRLASPLPLCASPAEWR